MFWEAVVISALFLVVTRSLWRRVVYDLHKIPSPPGLPLLGHTLDFMYGEGFRDITQMVGKGLKKLNYPGLIRFEVMGNPFLVVTNDEFLRTTMLSPKNPFPRALEDTGLALPLIGNDPNAKTMLFCDGKSPYVKAVRQVYATAFQSANLKAALPRLQKVIDAMLSVVEAKRKSGPVEMQKLLVDVALDAVGVVAFDMNFGALDGSSGFADAVVEAGFVATETYHKPLKTLYCKLFPNSKAGKHRATAIDRLTDEFKRLADEILRRNDPPSGEEPIWYGLKHLKDPETNRYVPYNSLVSEIGVVLVGAMNPIGNQIAWILALLASRPDVTEKIVKELEENGLYGPKSSALQFEDLGELTYLTAVIKEGLRVASIVPAPLSRKTPKDGSVMGYRVPAGTKITAIGSRVFFIDADWDDLETFKPERWLDKDDPCLRQVSAFSVGPRDCIGQKLAMLEMRLVIVALVQNYKFGLVGSYADLAKNTVTGDVILAKDGIWFNVTPAA